MFTPTYKASWENQTSDALFYYQKLVFSFDNNGDAPERGQIPPEEYIEEVKEDACQSFQCEI